MNWVLGFLVVASFAIAMWLAMSGLAMIIIGAIGHIFDIALFQYVSFWESAILSIIYSALGAGAASSAN